MSFWFGEVYKLQAHGGPAWAQYQQLVAECDASMYGSPAHEALGKFQKAWEQDPAAVLVAAAAKAAGQV
jgi:hypothetical protein